MDMLLFAYFGPETMLPLTSVVATVIGLFMMFGRNTTRLIRRAIRDWLPGPGRTRPVPRPHFQVATPVYGPYLYRWNLDESLRPDEEDAIARAEIPAVGARLLALRNPRV